jgi:hypothetical protein
MILILSILCRTSFLKCTKGSTCAFWTLDASGSNVVNDIRIGVDKGGVAMCFHQKRWNHVIDQDRLTCNRVQWMRFKAIEGGAIGNLDLYVCSMTSEQCEMKSYLIFYLTFDGILRETLTWWRIPCISHRPHVIV